MRGAEIMEREGSYSLLRPDRGEERRGEKRREKIERGKRETGEM